MNGKLQAGSHLGIEIPENSSCAYTKAANVLKKELLLRTVLDIHIESGKPEKKEPPSGLIIRFAALEALEDGFQEIFDPPLKILPYPDYSEHINLRVLVQNGSPAIWIISGSERTLIYGIGMLFRHLRFEPDGLSWDLTFADYQPLTPLRGCLFSGESINTCGSSFSINDWNDLLCDHALLGNNVIGLDSDQIPKEFFENNDDYPIDFIHVISKEPTSLGNCRGKYIYLVRESLNQSVKSLYERGARLKRCADNSHDYKELWISTDGLNEEELTELLDLLILERNPIFTAIVCGPNDAYYDVIKREMPLTMQLISMNAFSISSEKAFPNVLAKRYFEYAPLTYGALSVSNSSYNDVLRFIWSMLSWSPQPKAGDIAKMYGHWYFDAPLAEKIQKLIMEIGTSRRSELDKIKIEISNIPSPIKSLGLSQMKNLEMLLHIDPLKNKI